MVGIYVDAVQSASYPGHSSTTEHTRHLHCDAADMFTQRRDTWIVKYCCAGELKPQLSTEFILDFYSTCIAHDMNQVHTTLVVLGL